MGTPFTTQLDNLREILRVIDSKAPRNHDGELESHYYHFANWLRKGIAKAEKWQKSTEGQKGGELENSPS